MSNYKTYLNSQEVRELAESGELAEPNTPRPSTRIYLNQTHIFVTTWHRTRRPTGTQSLRGAWCSRTAELPTTKRYLKILRAKGYLFTTPSKQYSARVMGGWNPRQRKAHTAEQLVAA